MVERFLVEARLAVVYSKEASQNSGKAYPTTPGHFEQPSCAP
jgi:hypothetical protein